MSRASLLSRTQSLWVLRALTRPDRVDYLTSLVQRFPHGALVRSPKGRFLVTATSAAAKRVLVENSGNYRKGLGQAHARTIIGDGLLTAEGQGWRTQRQSAGSYLRARTIQPHIPALYAHATRCVDALAGTLRDWGPVDAAIPLADYTLSCLGEVFDLAPPDARAIHHAFDVVQDEAIFRSITQGMVPSRLRPGAARRVDDALTTLRVEVSHALGGGTRSDAWASFEGMCSLFLAGYETTASTLAWALHNLAGRPTLQAALACEGRALGESPALGVAETHGLGWSRAVLKETLRLRPPVWLISRAALGADVVDGVRIRPGDEVLILPAAAQRHGWDQGEQFSPERFDDPAQSGQTLWFGAGPRACPGGNLALLEGSIWLAVAMSRLELRLSPGVPVTAVARMSQIPAPTAIVQARARQTVASSRPTPSPTPAAA